MDRLKTSTLVWFFAAALVAHLASVVVIMMRGIPVSPIQDPLEYRMIAEHVLGGEGFRIGSEFDVLRVPLYSLFLAATLFFDGSGYLAVALQQMLLIGSGLCLFLILRRLHVSDRLALVVVALFLFEPLQWMLSLQTMSETLFAALGALLLLLFVHGRGSTTYGAALLGALAGFLVLTRDMGLFVLLPLLAALMMRYGLARSGVCALAAILVVSPWVVRNTIVAGAPMLSASSAYNIVEGFGTMEERDAIHAGVPLFDAKGREGRVFQGFTASYYPQLKALSRQVIGRGSMTLGARQLACAPRVWFDHHYSVIAGMIFPGVERLALFRVLDHAAWSVVFVLSLVGGGVMLARRLYAEFILLAGFVALTTFVNLCISYTRMQVPLYIPVFVCASLGLVAIYQHVRSRNTRLFEDASFPCNHATIVLDVDGTLVPDSETALDQHTVDAVASLKEKGNDIYLCTNGRARGFRERLDSFSAMLGVGLCNTAARKPNPRALDGVPVRGPLVIIGDKDLVDGLLARRLGGTYVKVKRKRNGIERFAVKVSYWLDDVFGAIVLAIWDIFFSRSH